MNRNKFYTECGATVVEFSLVSLLMFTIVTGIFDAAIVMRNHSLLTTATQQGARNVATQYYANRNIPTCEEVAKSASDSAAQLLKSNTGETAGEMSFVPGVEFRESYNGDFVGHVVLEGALKANCLFCHIFPGGMMLHAKSEIVIEDPSFRCVE